MSDAPAAAAPRFVNPAALIKAVSLQFPVEYAGVTYDAIYLRKLTAGEVAAFVKSFAEIRKTDPDATPRFPIFFGPDSAPVPPDVLDGLESDDFDTLDEAAADFLPRRFRPAPETTTALPDGSAPGTGEPTAPSSAA